MPVSIASLSAESTEFKQVLEAIVCLYSPSSPHNLRAEADVWLQRFQRRPEAWEMANKMLSCDPTESPTSEQVVIFAALTMRIKTIHDFSQLPSSSYESFRSTLLAHITRYNQLVVMCSGEPPAGVSRAQLSSIEKSASTTLRYLSISFSNILVNTSKSAGNDMRSLASLFPLPDGMVALLEILCSLPEVADDKKERVREELRKVETLISMQSSTSGSHKLAELHSARDVLRRSEEAIYGYIESLDEIAITIVQTLGEILSFILNNPMKYTNPSALQNRVLSTFTVWIDVCKIPYSSISSSPLPMFAFDCLVHHEKSTFSEAVSVVSKLCERYGKQIDNNPLFIPLCDGLCGLYPIIYQVTSSASGLLMSPPAANVYLRYSDVETCLAQRNPIQALRMLPKLPFLDPDEEDAEESQKILSFARLFADASLPLIREIMYVLTVYIEQSLLDTTRSALMVRTSEMNPEKLLSVFRTFLEIFCCFLASPNADVSNAMTPVLRELEESLHQYRLDSRHLKIPNFQFPFSDTFLQALRSGNILTVTSDGAWTMRARQNGRSERSCELPVFENVQLTVPLMMRCCLSRLVLPVAVFAALRMTQPPAAVWQRLGHGEKDDFRHTTRYDCADALLLCCDTNGYLPVLQLLTTLLQSALDEWKAALGSGAGNGQDDAWRTTEGMLYAIRSIARFVPNSEAQVLPDLVALLFQLPKQPEVAATTCRILGRYGSWLSSHPKVLQRAVQYLVGVLVAPSQITYFNSVKSVVSRFFASVPDVLEQQKIEGLALPPNLSQFVLNPFGLVNSKIQGPHAGGYSPSISSNLSGGISSLVPPHLIDVPGALERAVDFTQQLLTHSVGLYIDSKESGNQHPDIRALKLGGLSIGSVQPSPQSECAAQALVTLISNDNIAVGDGFIAEDLIALLFTLRLETAASTTFKHLVQALGPALLLAVLRPPRPNSNVLEAGNISNENRDVLAVSPLVMKALPFPVLPVHMGSYSSVTEAIVRACVHRVLLPLFELASGAIDSSETTVQYALVSGNLLSILTRPDGLLPSKDDARHSSGDGGHNGDAKSTASSRIFASDAFSKERDSPQDLIRLPDDRLQLLVDHALGNPLEKYISSSDAGTLEIFDPITAGTCSLIPSLMSVVTSSPAATAVQNAQGGLSLLGVTAQAVSVQNAARAILRDCLHKLSMLLASLSVSEYLVVSRLTMSPDSDAPGGLRETSGVHGRSREVEAKQRIISHRLELLSAQIVSSSLPLLAPLLSKVWRASARSSAAIAGEVARLWCSLAQAVGPLFVSPFLEQTVMQIVEVIRPIPPAASAVAGGSSQILFPPISPALSLICACTSACTALNSLLSVFPKLSAPLQDLRDDPFLNYHARFGNSSSSSRNDGTNSARSNSRDGGTSDRSVVGAVDSLTMARYDTYKDSLEKHVSELFRTATHSLMDHVLEIVKYSHLFSQTPADSGEFVVPINALGTGNGFSINDSNIGRNDKISIVVSDFFELMDIYYSLLRSYIMNIPFAHALQGPIYNSFCSSLDVACKLLNTPGTPVELATSLYHFLYDFCEFSRTEYSENGNGLYYGAYKSRISQIILACMQPLFIPILSDLLYDQKPLPSNILELTIKDVPHEAIPCFINFLESNNALPKAPEELRTVKDILQESLLTPMALQRQGTTRRWASVLRNLEDAIAQQQWKDFLSFLYQLAQSGDRNDGDSDDDFDQGYGYYD